MFHFQALGMEKGRKRIPISAVEQGEHICVLKESSNCRNRTEDYTAIYTKSLRKVIPYGISRQG